VCEETIQVLRLEVQILVPWIRQRILAMDSVEEAHGSKVARLVPERIAHGAAERIESLRRCTDSEPECTESQVSWMVLCAECTEGECTEFRLQCTESDEGWMECP